MYESIYSWLIPIPLEKSDTDTFHTIRYRNSVRTDNQLSDKYHYRFYIENIENSLPIISISEQLIHEIEKSERYFFFVLLLLIGVDFI